MAPKLWTNTFGPSIPSAPPPRSVRTRSGGYNSSNTCHLAALVAQHGVPTYHIEDAEGVDVGTGDIRHQPVGSKAEMVSVGWLEGASTIGITAGASTPNNKVGETIARICAVAGVNVEEAVG
jgi:4-hydroxy-3-methylbut-2-enyl diphosphate reductase